VEIRRNTSNSSGGSHITYSVFVPVRCERMGKYGFKVAFMGCIADGGFDVALNGVTDECHRRQYAMDAEALARGPHEYT